MSQIINDHGKIKFYLLASIYLLSCKTSEAVPLKINDCSYADNKKFDVEPDPPASKTIRNILEDIVNNYKGYKGRGFESENFKVLLGDLDLKHPSTLMDRTIKPLDHSQKIGDLDLKNNQNTLTITLLWDRLHRDVHVRPLKIGNDKVRTIPNNIYDVKQLKGLLGLDKTDQIKYNGKTLDDNKFLYPLEPLPPNYVQLDIYSGDGVEKNVSVKEQIEDYDNNQISQLEAENKKLEAEKKKLETNPLDKKEKAVWAFTGAFMVATVTSIYKVISKKKEKNASKEFY
ncbi:MAG: hypothetical protein AAF335_00265 [Bacteroidota bacterium]